MWTVDDERREQKDAQFVARETSVDAYGVVKKHEKCWRNLTKNNPKGICSSSGRDLRCPPLSFLEALMRMVQEDRIPILIYAVHKFAFYGFLAWVQADMPNSTERERWIR